MDELGATRGTHTTATDASGNTSEFSPPRVVAACLCRADVDGDGDVDMRDVALVFAHWPSPPKPYDSRYDIDDDGDIDIRDVALVFAQWPSPPKAWTP